MEHGVKKIKIEMEDDRAILQVEKGGGVIEEKYLHLQDIKDIFFNDILSDSGLLPSLVNPNGTVTIKRIAQKGQKGAIIIEGLNLIKDITYKETTYKDVPLPHIYMGLRYEFRTSGMKVTSSYLLATYNQVFDKGELFVPPFPNLYGNSNGQICWGGEQKLAKYTDPKQLIFAIDEFFSAAFNDDLYRGTTPFITHVRNMRDGQQVPMKPAASLDAFSRLLIGNL